jgi:hypothetical protein
MDPLKEGVYRMPIDKINGFIEPELTGCRLDDYLEGYWRGEEVVAVIGSHTTIPESIDCRFDPNMMIRVLQRSELSKEDLLKIKENLMDAYSRITTPQTLSNYDAVVSYLNRRIK